MIKIRILINSAQLQEFKSNGASLHPSYDDEQSLVKALEGVDVAVSALGAEAAPSQLPLIKATKAAGVKLLFPSFYGASLEYQANQPNPPPLIKCKRGAIPYAQEVGLPFAALSNGGFPECCYIPGALSPLASLFPYERLSRPFGYDFANKKVTVWGDGNASWLANLLKTVPISQLENKELSIEGNVATVNEVIKLREQKHNAKLEVDYRPLNELDDRVSASSEDFLAVLIQEWSSGRGEIGGKDNASPGWKPDTIESILWG